jgi:hypothetical protein
MINKKELVENGYEFKNYKYTKRIRPNDTKRIQPNDKYYMDIDIVLLTADNQGSVLAVSTMFLGKGLFRTAKYPRLKLELIALTDVSIEDVEYFFRNSFKRIGDVYSPGELLEFDVVT